MSIYAKLLAVQKAVDTIPKRGYNDFYKYHYATEADILTVKTIMNDQGVVVLSNMAHEETGFKPDGKSWAKVTLSFRLVDVETGECTETQFTGYAEDKADKAIYKATTGANKYFYLKYFGVATGDDPEQESQVPVQNAELQNWQPKKETKPALRQQGKQTAVVAPFAKNRALMAANGILALQKRYNLSNTDVLSIGQIDSIKGLAEVGDYAKLEQAAQRLQKRYQVAI